MWDEVIYTRTLSENDRFRFNEYHVRRGCAWYLWYAIFESISMHMPRDGMLVRQTEWRNVYEISGPDVHKLADIFKNLDINDIAQEMEEIEDPS